MVSALQLMNKMPSIYLFVVSIESIQQQGIELTLPIENTMPFLIDKIITLANSLIPAHKKARELEVYL